MKKILAVIAAAFCSVAVFAGCGSYSKPAGSTGGNVGGNAGKDPVVNTSSFKVTLAYGGKPYRQSGLKAQWSDGVGKTAVDFDERGCAEATNLNGDYRVTLLGLDAAYTYNPNIYFATNDAPDVEIEICRLSAVKGKGVAYDEYTISDTILSTNYYRATFDSAQKAKDGILFLYCPPKAGKYSIESIVDVTANEINPYIQVYQGSRQFFVPSAYVRIDAGGESSVYTKNFRYDVQLRKDEIGYSNVFRYMFKFNSRVSNVSYPFNIDFKITFEGEADELSKAVPVTYSGDFEARKAQLSAMGIPWNGTGWTYADVKKDFDGKNFKFDEDFGLWRRWDGENFGEILWAKINGDSAILKTDSGLGFMDTLVSTNNLGGYNYDQMVSDFSDNTNNGGCYPVTAEVKNFLQAFAVSQRYFMDGNGWAELHGYSSTEEDQWLFNCGYYTNA